MEDKSKSVEEVMIECPMVLVKTFKYDENQERLMLMDRNCPALRVSD